MSEKFVSLSSLNGSNGFTLNGTEKNNFAGSSVSSAGDVNGDGIDDVMVGAFGGSPNGTYSGQTYIVFGKKTSFAASIDLNSLNGSNGFTINGITKYDFSGFTTSSLGDINGDDVDDVMIGAFGANPNGDNSGQTYVVFGKKTGFESSLELSSLNGSNGFILNGVAANDNSSSSLNGLGDINGDGLNDLIIGAFASGTNGTGSGQSYVVFGTTNGFNSTINLSSLNGTNGFTIDGLGENDNLGSAVSGAGDINGDGFDDLIIGAPGASPNGDSSGQGYVIFGTEKGFDSSVNLDSLNGKTGFTINGNAENDFAGANVSSAGDINGDGFDDVMISSPGASANDLDKVGQTYVIFGKKKGYESSLNLSSLNGENGFTINGINGDDQLGTVLSSVGDFNNDGFDDLMLGTSRAKPNGDYSGQSYIVFGKKKGYEASLNLSSLNGKNGVIINGIAANDSSAGSLNGIGDVNNDGVDDVIIGAFGVSLNGANSGQSYVIFGGKSSSNQLLIGTANDDLLEGGDGNDTLKGLGGDDTLIGAKGADKLLGGRKADELMGDKGKDNLTGGKGQDTLTGGKGSDRFSFKNPDQGVDTITDFTVNEDNIVISASSFGGGLETGNQLKESEFVIGEFATTSQQRFIYNQSNGALLFDVDGNGSIAAIQLATLSNLAEITRTDIFVI